MPLFDLDAQRGLSFLFGVIGFATEAVVVWLGGPSLPDVMTGGLIAMIIGPVAGNTWDKYRERRQEALEEASQASRSDPPQSSSLPTTLPSAAPKDSEN